MNEIIVLNVYSLCLISEKYYELSFIVQVPNSCLNIYRTLLVENCVEEATGQGLFVCETPLQNQSRVLGPLFLH